MAKTKESKAPVSAAALLGQLAKKAPAKPEGKSDTPVVELEVPENVVLAAEKLIGAKKAMKQAESTVSIQEETLLPVCAEQRKKLCMDTQKFATTVKFRFKGMVKDPATGQEKMVEVEQISFQVQNKYTEIPVDSQEKLEGIFGELYGKCFNLDTQIVILPAGLKKIQDDGNQANGLLPKLIAACGGVEEFSKFFAVKQKLVPTEFFHEEQAKDAKLANLAEKATTEGLVKGYKPSLKVY